MRPQTAGQDPASVAFQTVEKAQREGIEIVLIDTAGRLQTKSGLMLGLGETHDELLDTLSDLRDAHCDFLTLGQYLQPTPAHLPVIRYVPPAEFDELGAAARQLGFEQVASGPFVRSSYHAREMIEPGIAASV